MNITKETTMFTILHTVANLEARSGGPSRTVIRLCEELSICGVKTILVTQKRLYSNNENVIPNPLTVQTIEVMAIGNEKMRLLYSPLFKRRLKKICNEFPISLLHDHGLWLPCNHASAAISRKLNIPLIISPRGMLEHWALSFKATKKKVAWRLYQYKDLNAAKAFCATSEMEFESIRRLGFKQPVAIIPNGVDLPSIQQNAISNPHLTVLFMSRLHPIKGLETLIDAWDKVRPNGWKLIIAGPDESGYGKTIQNSIKTRGLGNVVEMIGPVEGDQKWRLLRDSELFLLPTFSENFGVVVAEALVMGTPVITTKGAPWEDLINYECGWWIDMGVEPLVRALKDAIALSDKEREEMGQRGRKFVEERFSWPKIAEEMISVYRWVLGGGPPPDCVRLD